MQRSTCPGPARPIPPALLRTLALASLGGALEFYDFVIFAFLARPIAQAFFPASQADWLRQAETFGLFGAGYLARPIGGLIMAHFGDVSGRKTVFTLSVLLMALPTLVIGLLPDYAHLGIIGPLSLLLCRILQGAAIGGEAPGGWVFVAEHAPSGRVGLATGLLTGGLTGGILLGSIVILALHAALTPEAMAGWGWRVPFVIGGAFGLGAMILRRFLNETPVFRAMQAENRTTDRLPLAILLKTHRASILSGMMATWTLTAAIIVLVLMMPPLMQTLHHMPPARTMMASLSATLCLTISVIAVAALSDIVPMRPLTLGAAAGLALGAFALYGAAPLYPEALVGWAALGGLGCGFVGLVPVSMLRRFPPMVRFSGLSLSYNVAYATFGGLTPAAISALTPTTPIAPAIYVSLTGIIGALALWRTPSSSSTSGPIATAAGGSGAPTLPRTSQ